MIKERFGARWLVGLASLVFAAAVLAPWGRNHRVLLDFQDYGLVMAGAGRMQAGERPYVDFISPIQTLQFTLSILAEKIWGPRYLSLTYANAVLIVASLAGLSALLWKRLGGGLALLVAAAIVTASASQHTILWYNVLGVLWIAMVVWLPPESGARRAHAVGRVALVCFALWLGGMTKLTYQATLLAFAITLALGSAAVRRISWRTAWGLVGSYVLAGVVAPLATELWLTGASLKQWFQNVVVLPAQMRTDMLRLILTPRFYLHTPHDYYPPQYFAFAGLWGVAVLAAIAWAVRKQTREAQASAFIRRAFLLVLWFGAWICSSVLLATNMDSSFIAGAISLVLATGIAFAFFPEDSRDRRRVRIVLAIAAMSLLVPAWISAWHGARALWGHEPRDRAKLVSTDDLPERFGYLRGMKIQPSLYRALHYFDEQRAIFTAAGIAPAHFYFGNGTAWMVRVMPEAVHRGLPLWLAGGTTYSEQDAWKLADRIEHDASLAVMFGYAGWDTWYPTVAASVKKWYRPAQTDGWMRVYVRRESPGQLDLDPIEFAVNTHSNLYSRYVSAMEGTVDLQVATNGLFFLGGNTAHRIDFAEGLYLFSGEMVGDLPRAADTPARATFRVFARENGRLTDQFAAETIDLKPTERWATRTFSVSPGGRAISLVVELPAESAARFGWRKLETNQSKGFDPANRWPLNRLLAQHRVDEEIVAALFDGQKAPVDDFSVYGGPVRTEGADSSRRLVCSAPTEMWFRMRPGTGRVEGDLGFSQDAWQRSANAMGVRVSVIVFKAGRFDLMYRKDFHRSDGGVPGPEHFAAWLPEGAGWIGIVVSPLDQSAVPPDLVRFEHVKVR